MAHPRSISELLVAATSPDLSIASRACRELLNRHAACSNHVPSLIQILQSPYAPISDYAFRIIERIGDAAVAELTHAYPGATGKNRLDLLQLIAELAPFDTYLPLLQNEFDNGEVECRLWAANCLGRKYSAEADWPPEAMDLLHESITLLQATRGDHPQWTQARMTLQQLGLLEDGAR